MSQEKGKNPSWVTVFLISVSMFGLLLSNFFVFNPPTLDYDFAYRNLTIGIIFEIICISGILATLFPSSCLEMPQFLKSNKKHRYQLNIHKKTLHAHHPICENYASHVLSIGNLDFCATCSGLLVGAIIAIIIASLYFLGSLSLNSPTVLVLAGTTGVALGLIQSALPKFSGSLTRFVASILFVMGTSLMLASIDAATNNIFIDLFLVFLSVLWIMTKISLSQRDHELTCSNCSMKSCRNNKKGIC